MSKPQTGPQTYFILDKGMRYVGRIRLKSGQKTVLCTADEAKFFLENGGLSLTDPAETAAARKAAEGAPEPQAPKVEEPEAVVQVADETAAVSDEPVKPKAQTTKGR